MPSGWGLSVIGLPSRAARSPAWKGGSFIGWHPLGGKSGLGKNIGGTFLAHPFLGRLGRGLLGLLGGNPSAPLALAYRHNVARCRADAGEVTVPSSQRPHDLLSRPVLQFVAPPRQLRGLYILGLVRLKIRAQDDLHFRSNRLTVFG